MEWFSHSVQIIGKRLCTTLLKTAKFNINNLNLDNFQHQLLTFKEDLLFSGADGEAEECKLG